MTSPEEVARTAADEFAFLWKVLGLERYRFRAEPGRTGRIPTGHDATIESVAETLQVAPAGDR